MQARFLLVAAFAVFVVRDTPTTSTEAAEITKAPVAIIDVPETGDWGNAFSCYVCHPSMPSCGNRIDCCVTPNPEHIKACPRLPNHSCFKKVIYDGTFFNVTRGCGKEFAFGPSGQSDNECITSGADETNVVCNCITTECNSSTRHTFSIVLVILPFLKFLF